MSRYKIVEENGKKYIVDEDSNKVSKNWNEIWASGLVEGESEYYIAQRNDDKQAIFHKNNPDKPITKWWKEIWLDGLIEGKSDYYITQRDDGKESVFHKDNPNKPISKIWLKIHPNGLVKGESEYYKVIRDDEKEAIFHKDYKDIPLTEWLDNVNVDNFIEKHRNIPLNDIIANGIRMYIKGLC